MKEDKLDTLDYYNLVIYRHVPVKAPTNEIEHLKLEGCALRLLNLCCCSVEGSRVFLKLPNAEARTTLLRNCFYSTDFENLPTNFLYSTEKTEIKSLKPKQFEMIWHFINYLFNHYLMENLKQLSKFKINVKMNGWNFCLEN